MQLTPIARLSIFLLMAPSLALAQGTDFSVQGPSFTAPERGSIAGTYASLSLSAGSVSNGSFSLALPISAPAERGSPLIGFAPRYAPENGLSEWGMGWKSSLEIRREPVVGTLDYDVDEFISPWGRIVEGDDGRWYADGMASHVVLERDSDGWHATAPNGVEYRFEPAHRRGPDEIYSWELVEAEDLYGGRTVVEYEELAGGQRLVARIRYGSPAEPLLYSIEVIPEAVSRPTTSYRTGVAVTLSHRVKTVVMRRGQVERWRYTLRYSDNYYSPAFYLESIERQLAAGGTEPPVRYGYLTADETLSSLHSEPLPEATRYVRSAADVAAFSASRGSFIDFNRDGQLDFERVGDYAMMLRTEDGWTPQPLPRRTSSGFWSEACRPSQNDGTPRRLVRLAGWDDDVRVVATVAQGTTRDWSGGVVSAHTKFALCERSGDVVWVQDLPRDWVLGDNVLLVDLDQDEDLDLLRVRTGAFDVLVNEGGDEPFSEGPRGALSIRSEPAPAPQRIWFDDLNGDGLGDILATDGVDLYAWYGTGDRRFVEDAHRITLYRWASNRWFVDSVDDASVSFVDVNRDGLKDVLVIDGDEARLYPNGGTYFVSRNIDAFDFGFARGWVMENPLLADLSNDGNDELVYAGYHEGVAEVQGMQLSPPGTGLLSWVNDGKGSRVEFSFGRGPAAEDVGVRPIVLSSMRTRTVGLDAHEDGAETRFGELVYEYDYDQPVLHTENHQFRGYGATRRLGPQLVEVVHMHHDDHIKDVVLREFNFPRGNAWETDQDLRLYNYSRNQWEETDYAGVPWTRLAGSTSGWGQIRWSNTPPEARRYLWAPPEADEVQEFGTSNEVVRYEGLCVTEARTSNSRGSLTTLTELAWPAALEGALHCTAAKESVVGSHPDPRDDFHLIQRVERNYYGQVTDIFQGSLAEEQLLQTVEYDDLGRVRAISAPGSEGLITSRFYYDGALPSSVTRPDGVTVSVGSYDDLTDQMRSLSTDRGDGSVYTTSFSFDDFERLWRSWDNAGQSSAQKPLSELQYFFPTDDRLGRIEADVTVAQGNTSGSESRITRRGVSWQSGDGKEVASGALIPEGWMVSGLNARSRQQAWQRSYVRSPLVGSPGSVRYEDLLDGATELAFGQLDGLGEQVRTRQVLASEQPSEGSSEGSSSPELVEKTVTTRQVWTPQGMQKIIVENSTYVRVMQYDETGALLWSQDPGGMKTSFRRDAADRIRGVFLPDGSEQYLKYDDLGRPSVVTRPNVGEVRYFYAEDTGWIDRKEMRDTDGLLYRSVDLEYDRLGRVVRTIDHAPGVAPYVTESFFDGVGPEGENVVEGHRGLLTHSRSAKHSARTIYNPDGTLRRARVVVGDFIEVTSEYTYYADKSPRTVRRAVRNVQADRVIDANETEYKYDDFGRLDTVHLNGSVLAAMQYDEEGRAKYVWLRTGEVVEYHHDLVTKALNGYSQHTGALWNLSVHWSLDRRGFIKQERYNFGREQQGSAPYAARDIDRVYEYDARGFLTRSTDNGVETGYYEYDAGGLLSFARDPEGSRRPGRPSDRVVHLSDDAPSYVYDAAGRLIQRGETHFLYGAHGDVAEARTPRGTFRYHYDGSGQRILKTRIDEGEERPMVAYVGGAFITSDSIVEPVRMGGRLVGILENSAFHLLPTDPRGTSLGDLDGTVKMPSPYGVRAERPDLSEALDYTEKGYDPDLGLVRMGVRDYDPLLGQFTRPDPMFMESVDACAASPVECNLWGYALGNPVMFTDPTGLEGEPTAEEMGSVAAAMAADGTSAARGADGEAVWYEAPELQHRDGYRFSVEAVSGRRYNYYTPSAGSTAGAGGQGGTGNRPGGIENGAKTGGVPDGATYGGTEGPEKVPAIGGLGILGGPVADWLNNLVPKVSHGDKQTIDGLSIIAEALSGAASVAKKALTSAAKRILPQAAKKLDDAVGRIRAAFARPSKGAETLLPDSYWTHRTAPTQVSPGTRTVNDFEKPSSKGGTYHSTTHYDEYGRQVGQTHRTHHGYSNPSGDHYHPDPHHHRRDPVTGEKLKDPATGSRTWPGLFGN